MLSAIDGVLPRYRSEAVVVVVVAMVIVVEVAIMVVVKIGRVVVMVDETYAQINDAHCIKCVEGTVSLRPKTHLIYIHTPTNTHAHPKHSVTGAAKKRAMN